MTLHLIRDRDSSSFESEASNGADASDSPTGSQAADPPAPDWTRTADLLRPGPGKRQISLRLDTDVLAFFKRGGRGYQSRINAVLRAYMLSREDEDSG